MTANLLDDARAQATTDERARAARALLRRPLLTAQGPQGEAFRLVRRHAAWLGEWFAAETGWRLHVEPEFARLRKRPADLGDATRPAREARGRPAFSRRRYVLLCLALAALERAESQTTLGLLGEKVIAGAADPVLADAGVVFTMERIDERRDLVAVVRLLLGLGVLVRVAGDEQAYVDDRGDALYDVDRRVLSVLLVTGRGPSTVDATAFAARLAALGGEAEPEMASPAVIRRRLARRLLDDPVVYDADLDDDARGYLRTQRTQLANRLAGPLGLEPELRAEGICLLDPTGEATDAALPEEGTDGHATLLLAEHLAAAGDRAVPHGELVEHLTTLAGAHRSYWRKATRERDGVIALCRTAVERLAGLRLVEVGADGVRARPALARYAADEPTVAGRQESLL